MIFPVYKGKMFSMHMFIIEGMNRGKSLLEYGCYDRQCEYTKEQEKKWKEKKVL